MRNRYAQVLSHHHLPSMPALCCWYADQVQQVYAELIDSATTGRTHARGMHTVCNTATHAPLVTVSSREGQACAPHCNMFFQTFRNQQANKHTTLHLTLWLELYKAAARPSRYQSPRRVAHLRLGVERFHLLLLILLVACRSR